MRLPTTLILLILLAACREVPEVTVTPRPPAATSKHEKQQTIREVVEQFGDRLNNVPLLAPADELRRDIQREYEPLITDELLQRWLSDPREAAGRLTSSPWPDRIEIVRVREGEHRAVVFGEVVEVTSAGEALRVPVAIDVVRVGDAWRIGEWSSSAPLDTDDTLAAPAAAAVIESYYRAINDRAYDRAYDLWADSGQTREEFRAGFADTMSVRVETGEAGRVEGAAGSRYITVPVEITAVTRDKGARQFRGSYVLRRSVVDGATPEQRMWRIASADLRESTP